MHIRTQTPNDIILCVSVVLKSRRVNSPRSHNSLPPPSLLGGFSPPAARHTPRCFSMVLDKIIACPAINKRKTWEVLRIGDIIENNLVKPWLIRYFLIYLPQNKNMVLL